MPLLPRAHDHHRKTYCDADQMEIRFEMSFRYLVAKIPNESFMTCCGTRAPACVFISQTPHHRQQRVRISNKISQYGCVVYTHSFSLPSFRIWRISSRRNFNPHSPTFSIGHRVRRKHQQLPSSRVIESAVKIAALFRLVARHFR